LKQLRRVLLSSKIVKAQKKKKKKKKNNSTIVESLDIKTINEFKLIVFSEIIQQVVEHNMTVGF